MSGEQAGQHMQHIVVTQAAGNLDGQALAGVLVDHRQHPDRAAIMRAILHEVVGPDMVRPARPDPDTRSVVELQPPAFGLFRWHFQPLTPPDPPHPFHVHVPSLGTQQRGDPAIAVTAIFGSQVDNRSRQGVFIVATDRWTALRRAVLADHTTGTALRYIEPVLHVIDRGTPACGA